MTTQLRNGTTVEDPRLDRMVSETTEHLEKYPLTAATLPSVESSMMGAMNWYSNFDNPVPIIVRGKRRFAIGAGDLGSLRGGHATCLRHWKLRDLKSWWLYYNQGTEGRCVEFALLRILSQMNRKRYDITSRWHYWEMQRTDEWTGGSYPGATPQYEGTSGRAGLEVARAHGAIKARPRGAVVSIEEAPKLVRPEEGISVYRWATDWGQVRAALQVPDWYPGVPLNNSWGTGYPKEVILLDEAGERVLREQGEFGIVTDR